MRPREAEAGAIPGWSADRARLRPILAGVALLAVASTLGLLFGSVPIPVDQLFAIVAARLPGVEVVQTWPTSFETIVWEIRLPRVVLAGVVGAVLAVAGVAYQGVFRNPLADPYLIGVAGGAGLGATIAIVSPLAASFYGFSMLPLMAFAGAMLAVGAAYRVARIGRTVPAPTLILAGVAIAALASAGTSFLMINSGENVRVILSWLLGGFTIANWDRVLLILPYVVAPVAVLLLSARVLNLLQLDEMQARLLGVRVERAKLVLLASASLATAAAVAVSGLIGFVGLIVPHAVRLLVGPDHRILTPVSVVAGAAFMIVADLIARTALGAAELPVGVVTALAGAPFFLFLLRKRKTATFR